MPTLLSSQKRLLQWQRFLLAAGLLFMLGFHTLAQVPSKQWDRRFGSNGRDVPHSVCPTPDGGSVVAGTSDFGLSGDKGQPGYAGMDFWVLKVDAQGAKQWDRSFGGNGNDDLYSVWPTSDGGFILGGHSDSGISGNKSQPGRGVADYWVVKVDAQGNKQWDRTFGGSSNDVLRSVQQTTDGGYVLAGSSLSPTSGDKTQPQLGFGDYWVVKLDAQGNKQWDRSFGGRDYDVLTCATQTTDGGFLLGGFSASSVSGDKSEPCRGGDDYWVVKVDAQGNKQWDRTFGGTYPYDDLESLQQTSDGGYILGGYSASPAFGDKTEPCLGFRDVWVIKLSPNGQKQWDRTFGGSRGDQLTAIRQTRDGGYVLGSFSDSGVSGHKSQPSQGDTDYWVVKISAQGVKQWDQSFGGDNEDYHVAMHVTADGDYILAGLSNSGATGDKSQPGWGGNDFWVVKLGLPRLSGDTLLCAGGQARLSVPALAVSQLWSTGARTPSIVVTQPGVYTATCTFADGSTLLLHRTVRLFVPSLAISGDSLLCGIGNAQLMATAPGASSIHWSTGAGTASITVAQAGRYTATATYASGCTLRVEQQVRRIPPLPPPALGRDTTLCEGSNLLLRGPVGTGLTYLWSDGSTSATLRAKQAGVVSLQVKTPCETLTSRVRLDFIPCLAVPNVITPNRDGRNDAFSISGITPSEWVLDVYSRWGNRVLHADSYDNNWGDGALPGHYFYVLRRVSPEALYKGWVEVIR